jgi:hypothetical protein
MIQSSLLFYKKFRKDLEGIGFKVNPYDPCVANRTINSQQHTITWHVDDVKSSHVDPKVNDDFHTWLESMYGDDDIGNVKSVRGKIHDYLGMRLDYTEQNVFTVDMTDYIDDMVTEFFEEYLDEFKKNAKYPWDDKLFSVNPNSPSVEKKKAEVLHAIIEIVGTRIISWEYSYCTFLGIFLTYQLEHTRLRHSSPVAVHSEHVVISKCRVEVLVKSILF